MKLLDNPLCCQTVARDLYIMIYRLICFEIWRWKWCLLNTAWMYDDVAYKICAICVSLGIWFSYKRFQRISGSFKRFQSALIFIKHILFFLFEYQWLTSVIVISKLIPGMCYQFIIHCRMNLFKHTFFCGKNFILRHVMSKFKIYY